MNSFYSNCPSLLAEVQLAWLRQSSHKVPTAATKYTESPKKQPKHSHNCGDYLLWLNPRHAANHTPYNRILLVAFAVERAFCIPKKHYCLNRHAQILPLCRIVLASKTKSLFPDACNITVAGCLLWRGLRLLRIRRGLKFVCTAMWMRRCKNRIAILVECMFALFRTPIYNGTSHPCL